MYLLSSISATSFRIASNLISNLPLNVKIYLAIYLTPVACRAVSNAAYSLVKLCERTAKALKSTMQDFSLWSRSLLGQVTAEDIKSLGTDRLSRLSPSVLERLPAEEARNLMRWIAQDDTRMEILLPVLVNMPSDKLSQLIPLMDAKFLLPLLAVRQINHMNNYDLLKLLLDNGQKQLLCDLLAVKDEEGTLVFLSAMIHDYANILELQIEIMKLLPSGERAQLFRNLFAENSEDTTVTLMLLLNRGNVNAIKAFGECLNLLPGPVQALPLRNLLQKKNIDKQLYFFEILRNGSTNTAAAAAELMKFLPPMVLTRLLDALRNANIEDHTLGLIQGILVQGASGISQAAA